MDRDHCLVTMKSGVESSRRKLSTLPVLSRWAGAVLRGERGTVVPLLTSAAAAPWRPMPALAVVHTQSISAVQRVLTTTNDGGSVTQGEGVPDHQVSHSWCAAFLGILLSFFFFLGKAGVAGGVAIRLLLSDPGGGGGGSPDPPTHPPTHVKQLFLRQKNEICPRGRKFDADFRYANVFLASTHPPTGGGGGLVLLQQ